MTPDERRAAVLDAAIPLLMENGIGVTTRQIADAAGVAEGTLFRVFDDKRALLVSAVGRALVRRYPSWKPWLVDETTVDQAWALQDRFALNYWDALMVAAAQQQGCTVLLTEDLQHDQRIDGLRIVNPFLLGPEILDAPA